MEEETGNLYGAEFTYFEVQTTTRLPDGSVLIYFQDAPDSAIVDPGQELKIATDPESYGSEYFPDLKDRIQVANTAREILESLGDVDGFDQLNQLASRGFCGWKSDLTDELELAAAQGASEADILKLREHLEKDKG